MDKSNNLQDRVFGQLAALKRTANTISGKVQWLCRCACGNEKVFRADNLVSGRTTSCGCIAVGRKPDADKRQMRAEVAAVAKAYPWLGIEPDQPFVKKIQIDGYDGTVPGIGGSLACGFGHAKGVNMHGVEFETVTDFRARPKRRGPVHVVAIRTLERLAKLGHIDAQGRRSYEQWMLDCGVAFTMRHKGDTHSIGIEFERLGGHKEWPRGAGDQR